MFTFSMILSNVLPDEIAQGTLVMRISQSFSNIFAVTCRESHGRLMAMLVYFVDRVFVEYMQFLAVHYYKVLYGVLYLSND